MKRFLSAIVMTFVLFSLPAWAKVVCYDFEVAKFSKGLTNISVSVPMSIKHNSKFKISMSGAKLETKKVSIDFDCIGHHGKSICSQANGGGDFIFQIKKGIPELTLSYLNLKVGAKDSNLNSNEIIDEEYAMFEPGKSDDPDAEENSGELDEFSITGQMRKCE